MECSLGEVGTPGRNSAHSALQLVVLTMAEGQSQPISLAGGVGVLGRQTTASAAWEWGGGGQGPWCPRMGLGKVVEGRGGGKGRSSAECPKCGLGEGPGF